MIAIKRPGSKLHQQRLVSNNIISSFSLTGGIAKKVEEAAVISTLGIDVTIALAGGKAGRLACMLSPVQIRSHSDWEGTCVLTCK